MSSNFPKVPFDIQLEISGFWSGTHRIKNREQSADWLIHQFKIVISKLVAWWLILNFYLWYLPRFGFEDLNFVNLYDEDCVVDDLNDVHFDEDDFMQF